LSHSASPCFCSCFFQDKKLFAQGWLWTTILISAS
jgi:hypothetical protein